MLLRAICALVLLGILVAGLWPFHAPRNEVRWLGSKSGLFLGKHGSIVSAGPFKTKASPAEGSCSIEIWLQPRRVNASGTILAFYWPGSRAVPLALRQSLDDLELQRSVQGQLPHAQKARVYVHDVFGAQKPVLVTISGGGAGTTISVNGVLVKRSPNFGFLGQELTGQLILGNSPVTTDNWSGQLMGLAVYGRELTSGEVSQHYEYWTKGKQADLAGDLGTVALYRFNEGNGSLVHNQADSATDLLIPERFFVLHEQFLERPWDEFQPGWSYWKNVAINIAGFIPLGFFFQAYFSSHQSTRRALASTIAFGFAISLTIEVLQAFLPTRDSGMTDLVTNTFGTALGAILFAWTAARLRAGIPILFVAEK